jgi:pimeloyl-ACP methyl ester carboxylesterase
MGRHTVGWPLCYLLRHNYDNRARLRDLATRQPLPRITIFHGGDDGLIPASMGRELASLFPAMITFHEIPGADHNSVLSGARAQIFAAMQ